jgi:uncharacterized membrane protein (UPF0182 family)
MSDPATRLLKGGRLFISALVLGAALLLLGRGLAHLYVEALWHQAAGYPEVFWTRFRWGWFVRLIVLACCLAVVVGNLHFVAKTLGRIQIRRRFGDLEFQEQVPKGYIRAGVWGAGVFLAVWISATVPLDAGIALKLALQAPEWGLVEPILQRDAGFYVFALPVIIRVLAFCILLAFLLLSLSAAGYVSTGALRVAAGRLRFKPEARRHLATLGAVFLVLLAGRFWVTRYLFLLDGTSAVEGILGFTDAQARIPAMQFLTFASIAAAAAVFEGGRKGRPTWILSGIVAVVLASLGVGQLYPSLVQRFRVEPNELSRETPYIEHALSFTRIGFGLDGLDRTDFQYTPPGELPVAEAARQLAGLPVWTPNTLLLSFRELEARFRYYDFPVAAIDRYPSSRGRDVVAIGVREVDPSGIEDPNWQNLHIRERYVAGMGAVVGDATGATAEGRLPRFLRSIPPELDPELDPPEGLALDRPEVFFGSRSQLYAILNPTDQAFLAPDGTPGTPGTDFPQGIQLSSLLRSLTLAWRFSDANLLFASEVTRDSRFVFRRQVAERVRAVAPFFRYTEQPYPVIHEGRVVWILEGFTATRNFPLSTAHELSLRRPVSYVRGSLKITVDAVTGELGFFAVDDSDPLLEAYREIFPNLVKPLSEMPEGLRDHVRYPRSLLELQSRVLTRYHLETAPLFHGQQDVWSLAEELGQGTTPGPYFPEYGEYRLPGAEEPEFLLTTVFVPTGRQNLAAILAASSDPDTYGRLTLFDLPVEDQVAGPRQIEALVEQDPAISQQFSLWRQGGSRVWSGHLHLVPVAGTLIYMEPIFLAADADAIPELRRFVVSDGRRVSMQPTLSEALLDLSRLASNEGLVAQSGDPVDAAAALPTTPSPGLDIGAWPTEALRLLDAAEARLRDGDYAGFGQALEELRRFLRDREGSGS